MLMKKTRLARVLTVLLALMFFSVGALADDYTIEVVGESGSTGGGRGNDSVVVEYVEPVPDSGLIVVVDPSGSSGGGDEGHGDEGENVYYEETPIYKVTFYNQSGQELGWLTVYENDYIIEPQGTPQIEGQEFLFWYDASEEYPAPYVFGSAVTKDLYLFPYYMAIPGYYDNQGQTQPTAPDFDNAHSQSMEVIQEILSQQEASGEYYPSPRPNDTANELIGEIVAAQNVIQPPQEPAPVYEEPDAVMATDQAIQLITDILSEEVLVPDSSDSVAAPESQANQLIGEILASDGAQQMQQEATQDVVSTQDQANVLINEMLAQEPRETAQDAAPGPEVTNTLIGDILAQQQTADTPQEQPGGEAGETGAAVSTQERTSELINEMLTQDTLTGDVDVDEPEIQPEQNSDLPEDARNVLDTYLPAADGGEQATVEQEGAGTSPEAGKDVDKPGEQPDELIDEILGSQEEDAALKPEWGASEDPVTPPKEEEDLLAEGEEKPEGETSGEAGEEVSGEPGENAGEPVEEKPLESTDEGVVLVTVDDEGEESEALVDQAVDGGETAKEGDGETLKEEGLAEVDAEDEGDKGDGENADETGEPTEVTGEEPDKEGLAVVGGDAEDETLGEDEVEVLSVEEITGETDEEGLETVGEEDGDEEALTLQPQGLTEIEELLGGELIEIKGGEDGTQDLSGVNIRINNLSAIRDGVYLADYEPVYFGDTIEMRGSPTCPDYIPYSLQWQVNRSGDAGDWVSIADATGTTYQVILGEENLHWQYRLVMIVDLSDL